MITDKERKKLQNIFRDRDLKKTLIERSQYSRTNVNYVLNGRHKNHTVIELAYKIIQEKKNEHEQLKNLTK